MLRTTFCMALLAFIAGTAQADPMRILIDRQRPGDPLQIDPVTGNPFTEWSDAVFGTGASITIDGVMISEFNAGGQGQRDRMLAGAGAPNIVGTTYENLLRDFNHASSGPPTNIRLLIEGLQPATDYQITLFGYDTNDNKDRGVKWYLGDDNTGLLLAAFYNDHSVPATNPPIPFIFDSVFNTGAGDSLSFFGEGDNSVQGPSNPNATAVIFGGLIIQEVVPAPVPEPTAIAMWSLLGLVGVGYAWRQRRRTCG